MKLLDLLLIRSYIWISLGASLLCLLSSKLLGFDPDPYLLLFCFGGTLSIYNFHRWYKPGKVVKIWDTKFLLVLSGGILAGVALLKGGNLMSLPVIAISGIIALLYIVPFGARTSASKDSKSIRERRGFKLWAIALTWCLSTAILPHFWMGLESTWTELCWIGLERFFFIAGITIPFDIRDIYTDHADLKTVPQRMGILRSKYLALVLTTSSFVCLLMAYPSLYFGEFKLLIHGLQLLNFAGVLFIIALAGEGRPKWYYAVVMDGLTISYPLISLTLLT